MAEYSRNITDDSNVGFYVSNEDGFIEQKLASVDVGSFVYFRDTKALAQIVSNDYGDKDIIKLYSIAGDNRLDKSIPRWNDTNMRLEWSDGTDLSKMTLQYTNYESGYYYCRYHEVSKDNRYKGNDNKNGIYYDTTNKEVTSMEILFGGLYPEINVAFDKREEGVVYAVTRNSGHVTPTYDFYLWDNEKGWILLSGERYSDISLNTLFKLLTGEDEIVIPNDVIYRYTSDTNVWYLYMDYNKSNFTAITKDSKFTLQYESNTFKLVDDENTNTISSIVITDVFDTAGQLALGTSNIDNTTHNISARRYTSNYNCNISSKDSGREVYIDGCRNVNIVIQGRPESFTLTGCSMSTDSYIFNNASLVPASDKDVPRIDILSNNEANIFISDSILKIVYTDDNKKVLYMENKHTGDVTYISSDLNGYFYFN